MRLMAAVRGPKERQREMDRGMVALSSGSRSRIRSRLPSPALSAPLLRIVTE